MRRFILALFALTLLSGCGGVDGSLMATAVRNTKAAGGAELAFQMAIPQPGGAEPVVMSGSGLEDLSHERAQMNMQVPGAGELALRSERMVVYMHLDELSSEPTTVSESTWARPRSGRAPPSSFAGSPR